MVEDDTNAIEGDCNNNRVDSEEEKQQIIKQLIKLEQDQEALKHKLNNDKKYINLLHEYNYLKVSRGVSALMIRKNNGINSMEYYIRHNELIIVMYNDDFDD